MCYREASRNLGPGMRGFILSVFLTAFLGLEGNAETRGLLSSHGIWSLYRVQSFELAVGNMERVKIDEACVIEASVDRVLVNFVTLVPTENQGRAPLFGSVILQISSPDWSFHSREANLSLVSGPLRLTVAGSLYDFDTVNFNMGGNGAPPASLMVFIEMASEPIQIFDDGDVSVVQFSSSGLRDVFNDMLRCGTV